jgi:hypothetical protein
MAERGQRGVRRPPPWDASAATACTMSTERLQVTTLISSTFCYCSVQKSKLRDLGYSCLLEWNIRHQHDMPSARPSV